MNFKELLGNCPPQPDLFSPGKGSEGTPLFDTPTTPHPTREAAEKAKQEAEAEERERMQLLVSSFTEDQLDR